MPRQAVVAFLAGSLIIFTAGLIGIFAVHNEVSKDMILMGTAGCFLAMFYVMWASGQRRQQEEYEAARNTIINYPDEPPAEVRPGGQGEQLGGVTFPTMWQQYDISAHGPVPPAGARLLDASLEGHGGIVKTGTRNGQICYIEFADGYCIGTPPPDEDKKDRDRYEAVKV